MTDDSPRMIDTDAGLERACERLSSAPSLALDTEFTRERTFTPQLGLIQISDGDWHALIDPLAVNSLEPFYELLTNKAILKLLHAPREDLEIFVHMSGRVCEPIFDTQTAAAFAGYGQSVSYQNLVRDLVGASVPKLQTRTDWLRRPLTEDQKKYAILDVVHLHPMHEILSRQLDESGRSGWVEEEFRILERLTYDEDPLEYYRRVKQAWRMTRRQLGVLRLLCGWRDEEALKRDCLRQGVAPDDVLVDLAKMQPTRRDDLRSLKRLHPREINRSGDRLIALIRQGKKLSDDELPEPIPSPVNEPALLARVDFLASAIRIKAMEMNMAHEVLAKKRSLEALVKAYVEGKDDPFPPAIQGWRRDVLGDYLIRVLEGRVAFRINPDERTPPLELVDI